MVIHVREEVGEIEGTWIEDIHMLTRDLGGSFEVLQSEEPVDAVLAFAYKQFVTQIVVGAPLSSRWQEIVKRSFASQLIRRAENIDIHLITRRRP